MVFIVTFMLGRLCGSPPPPRWEGCGVPPTPDPHPLLADSIVHTTSSQADKLQRNKAQHDRATVEGETYSPIR